MHHVIVGAGPAGVVAAETLRKADADCRITIVGDEPEPPYSRMAIPYLLEGQIDEKGTYLRKADDHYAGLSIEVIRDRVASLDTGVKELTLASGGKTAYDRLLIATGSSPLVPPVSGVDRDGVHTCWTLEDARSILTLASKGAPVVLIGAGFIGSIILEALATRGVDLTVVEMQDRTVPRMLNDRGAELLKRWCEQKGVQIRTTTRVEAIEDGTDGARHSVRLDPGGAIPADLVVVSAGVKPNVSWLEGSGLKIDQGVVVDDHLRSSDPDIFAAGDVAQGPDFSTGGFSVHAVQPTAVDHARVAALNMTGKTVRYQGSVQMNVLDTLGLVSTSFGSWDGVEGGDQAEQHDAERFEYINLQFKGDVLVGASSVGITDHIGVLRGLIQSRVKLGDWKEKLKHEPKRVMEAYLARTQPLGLPAKVLH